MTIKSCNKIHEGNGRCFSLTFHLQCKNLRQQTERHFVTLLVFNFVFNNNIEVSLGQLRMQKPPKRDTRARLDKRALNFCSGTITYCTRTQPLISGGCSVHYWVLCAINKRSFLRLHLCWHTFASLWGACLRFASLWRANSLALVIRVPSALIFQTFAEVSYSVFVRRSSFKSLLNLRKAYTMQ